MKRLPIVARALAFASLAAMLAGCKTVAQSEITDGVPYDYRLRHPIAVREGKQALTVFIGDRRGGLTPLQRAEVAGLVSGWRRDATGGFVIEIPVGGANERAAASVAREIRAVLSAGGVPGHSIEMRPVPTQDPIRLGTIRVNYPRMVAETGPCGLWPEDLGPSVNNKGYYDNKPYYNFGCANQRNLAAMVDNPADLVQPRPETPAYWPRRNAAFEKYKRGTTTTTNYPEADKAKLSDTGK
jgi:pilus assembly protein CpaD